MYSSSVFFLPHPGTNFSLNDIKRKGHFSYVVSNAHECCFGTLKPNWKKYMSGIEIGTQVGAYDTTEFSHGLKATGILCENIGLFFQTVPKSYNAVHMSKRVE